MILTDGPLQWGHDLAVMERLPHSRASSMAVRQLQWGHDLAVMERGPAGSGAGSPSFRFNGAMTLRSWRGLVAVGEVPGVVASMGP